MEKEIYMIGQELIEIFEKVLKTENISVARSEEGVCGARE